ncbi:MAG: lytic transglycosylase domain-containing protein [Candidatus Muiribacteriota bacterium]
MKKYLFIFLLLFYFILNIFSINREYEILLNIDKKNYSYSKQDLKIVKKLYKRDTSIKWYAGYLLYNFYLKENNFEKVGKYLSRLYHFSFIDDEKLINDYVKLCVKNKNFEKAIEVISKEKKFYNNAFKNIIINNFDEFKELVSENELINILYSMGFYEAVLQFDFISPAMKLKSLYGLRKHDEVKKIYNNYSISDKTALYFAARSMAVGGAFNKASEILSFAANDKHQTRLYYYIFYSILAQKYEVIGKSFNKLSNLYFKSKIVETIFNNLNKEEINSYINLYDEIINEPFIASKIYFENKNKFDLKKPPGYKNSVYNNINKKIYKENRSPQKYTNYFKTFDHLINEMTQLRPYIVYNDIELTRFSSTVEKSLAFFESRLPYNGLSLSWQINDDYYHFLRYPLAYYNEVSKIASELNLDPYLIWAIMREESAFRWSVSERGASGLMQIIPATGEWLENQFGIKKHSDRIYHNIYLGAFYLDYLLKKYDSTANPMMFAVMAYNAGQGNVDKWIKRYGNIENVISNIPFFETERYLNKVINSYLKYINIYE